MSFLLLSQCSLPERAAFDWMKRRKELIHSGRQDLCGTGEEREASLPIGRVCLGIIRDNIRTVKEVNFCFVHCSHPKSRALGQVSWKPLEAGTERLKLQGDE